MLTETIAELILSDFAKKLVTVNCCWLPSRFNILAIPFLDKVVFDPQSRVVFVSTEIGPFDIIEMTDKKVLLFQFLHIGLLQLQLVVKILPCYDC